jgi:hypothetical protein
MSITALVLALLPIAQDPGSDPDHPVATQATGANPTAATLAVWQAHILPRPEEMRWEQIPWLSTFAGGLAAAARARRPLLLWAMNGHPLGCT